MKKIYLAGPDVFEENALTLGKGYVNLCLKYGYKGLYPLDNSIEPSLSKEQTAHAIYQANIELIHQADFVIANLNPFRGKEADSGTVWECGYAHALGKKVYGYMQTTQSYLSSFDSSEKETKNGLYFDSDNRIIEDFNLPINLMIACSAIQIIEGSLEEILIMLQKEANL